MPWRLVSLIREFTDQFAVLVPFRAFSAATLTALGANEIVMHPMGTLGPTDPTVTNQFNPVNPHTQQLMGVSVEDVTAYLQLVKEDAGITHEDELVQAFNILADKVHPLALGNVKRILSQSRSMATKLLSMHLDKPSDNHKIQEIVESLTSKLFYHGHPISRDEAKKHVGLPNITCPGAKIESLMWDLFVLYEEQMLLNSPFNVATEFHSEVRDFSAQPAGTINKTSCKRAKMVYIESDVRTDVRVMEYELQGTRTPDLRTIIQLNLVSDAWQHDGV